MRDVKLKCANGYEWKTECNGADTDIKEYFLGNYFNTALYPAEVISKCVFCSIDGEEYNLKLEQ